MHGDIVRAVMMVAQAMVALHVSTAGREPAGRASGVCSLEHTTLPAGALDRHSMLPSTATEH